MDDIFSALADPIRRRLVERLLADNGQTLRKLSEGISLTRQGMAKHLAALEGAGLVVAKRAGREKLHFIRTAPLEALADGWLARFRGNAKAAKPQAAPSRPAQPKPPPPHPKRIDTRRNHLSKRKRMLQEMDRQDREELARMIKSGRVSGPGNGAS